MIANAALAATAATAEVARLSLNLVTTRVSYPPGNGPRGLAIGHVADQNLADNFPTVDNFDEVNQGVISLKSTTAIADRGTLVQNIGNWAAELDELPPVLPGRWANGQPLDIVTSTLRYKALIVAIPADKPVGWNIAVFENTVQEIEQLYKVEIEVIPIEGLVE